MKALLSRRLWRESLRIEREQLLWWPAVRMLLGIALMYGGVTLSLGPVLGMSAATGALMVSLAALGGPSRVRTQMALAMSIFLGLAVALGMLLSPYPLLVALVVAVWAAAFALLGAVHPIYQTVSALSVAYLVSYSAGDSSAAWWMYGLVVAGGGLAQLGYLNFLWPLRPFQPERTALSDVLRAISAGLKAGVDEPQPGLVLYHAPALSVAQMLAAQSYAPAQQADHEALVRLLDDAYLLDAAVSGVLAQGTGGSGPQSAGAREAPTSELAATYTELADLLDEFAEQVKGSVTALPDADWPRWEAALAGLHGPAGDSKLASWPPPARANRSATSATRRPKPSAGACARWAPSRRRGWACTPPPNWAAAPPRR